MSGMTLAAPAWAIRELIDMPQIKKARIFFTAREAARRAATGDYPLTGETANKVAQESDNPAHKEDFKSLLGVAARKPPQAD
jgi:hypothetical protein